MMTRLDVGILAFLAFLALGPAEAAAHGDATLEGPDGTVGAGQGITLSGAGFAPGESHRLVLRGTLDDYELGTATAGADSTFTVELAVPAGARPGQYRVVALAPDGDEVATLDLPVTAARETAEEADAGASGSTSSGRSGPEARADEIVIERSRAGIEWGVIGLVIGLAGGLGVGLFRRS